MVNKIAVKGNSGLGMIPHPRVYRGPAGHVLVPTYSAFVPGTDRRKRLKKAYSSPDFSLYESESDSGEHFLVDINTGNYITGVVWKFNLSFDQFMSLQLAKELSEIDFVVELQNGFTSTCSASYNHPQFGDIKATLFFQADDNSQGIAVFMDKQWGIRRWKFQNQTA